jgi:hypothetical protein
MAEVGDLVQRTENGRTGQVLGGWAIERSGDTRGFLVEPQYQGLRVVSGLASKSFRRFSLVWPQNRWRRVSWFGSQNRQLWFGDLGLKITATASWFRPQNQAGFGLLITPQNRWREDGVGYASRSGSLLRLEASHARGSQSDLKTSGGVMAGDARGTVTEVASGSN